MKTTALSILLLAALTLTGCVSSRYKLAKPADTTPSVALNLKSQQDPRPGDAAPHLEVAVNSVIIFQGPGSWKHKAYWDEYVVTLTNRGTTPLIVESAQLTGLAGTPMGSGNDPWALESQSRTLAEKGFGLAKNTIIQIGGGIGALSLGMVTGAALSSGGWAAIGGAMIGSTVALPLFVGTAIYRNVSSRHAVRAEFDKRKLDLPVGLVPTQHAQGSLFFPITPGPQRLVLNGYAGPTKWSTVVDLCSLESLHLKTSETP